MQLVFSPHKPDQENLRAPTGLILKTLNGWNKLVSALLQHKTKDVGKESMLSSFAGHRSHHIDFTCLDLGDLVHDISISELFFFHCFFALLDKLS